MRKFLCWLGFHNYNTIKTPYFERQKLYCVCGESQFTSDVYKDFKKWEKK